MDVWRPHEIIEAAMEIKGNAIRDGDEMCPALLLVSPTLGMTVSPWFYPTEMLFEAAMTLRDLQFTEASFVADGYGITVHEAAKARRVQHGDLARRFKAGDPEVCEQLTAYSQHRDGRSTLVVVQYKLDYIGIPIFEDPIYMESDAEHSGTVVEALRCLVGVS